MPQENIIKVNTPEVVFEIFDDEIVLVNLETGNYYSFSGSASQLWQYASEGYSTQQVIKAALSTFNGDENQITQATQAFLDELVEEKIIQLVEGQEKNIVIGASNKKENFETPVLDRYTDMQDLLLLDPIHEVDEDAGWPKPLDNAPKKD